MHTMDFATEGQWVDRVAEPRRTDEPPPSALPTPPLSGKERVELPRTDAYEMISSSGACADVAAANVGTKLQKGKHEKETITKVGERAA